jgi:hypothetical protein
MACNRDIFTFTFTFLTIAQFHGWVEPPGFSSKNYEDFSLEHVPKFIPSLCSGHQGLSPVVKLPACQSGLQPWVSLGLLYN